MLSQLLAAHEQLSDWAKWLVTGTRTPAVELRVFLDRALRHLPVPNRVRKRRYEVTPLLWTVYGFRIKPHLSASIHS